MLENKDINKLSELTKGFTKNWTSPEFIYDSLNCLTFSKLNKNLTCFKSKGYSFEWIISLLLSLPFVGISSVNKLSGLIEAKKDVFYRIKNNPTICWRYIQWLFATKFIKVTGSNNCDEIKCLVFDDTVIEKTGKHIERVSRVWDHVKQKAVLGYKLLVMGYWDGTSFIPLDFSLHREKGKNKRYPFGLPNKDYRKQCKKKRKLNSHGSDRLKEADLSKIDSMLRMLKRAISHNIKIDYVLTDSWFTCEPLINLVKRVKNQSIHVIGMYKIAKTLFDYKNEKLSYSQIRNKLPKPKRCRKLKLYYQQVTVELKGHKITLFFTRQGKNGKWKVLLTTNNSLGFIKLVEIYQTRWTIEIFFKESKQLLGLGNCQSNNFDAQIADTTLTMIQHIMLTLRYRYDNYETLGALFEHVYQTNSILKLNERIWLLFVEILSILSELFELNDEINILGNIINHELAFIKLKKLFESKMYNEFTA